MAANPGRAYLHLVKPDNVWDDALMVVKSQVSGRVVHQRQAKQGPH